MSLFITKCLHLHILLSFIYSLQSVYIYTSFYHLSIHYKVFTFIHPFIIYLIITYVFLDTVLNSHNTK